MKKNNYKGINFLKKGLNNPFYSASFLAGNFAPSFFRNRYLNQTNKFGVKGKYFILSFDCDTEKDIEVVDEVHQRLARLNITPSYAVPGELLKKGASEYSKLKNKGAEFILSLIHISEPTRPY